VIKAVYVWIIANMKFPAITHLFFHAVHNFAAESCFTNGNAAMYWHYDRRLSYAAYATAPLNTS
jgi:hypothetical protein